MREDICKRVKQVFEQNGVLIYEEEGIEKLEIDSLQFVSTIADIEIEFGIQIPDEILNDEQLNSLEDFCKAVEELVEGSTK